jgi:hypothetical protein
VNYLADVLHGFWLAAGQPVTELHAPMAGLVFVVIAVTLAGLLIRYKHVAKFESISICAG